MSSNRFLQFASLAALAVVTLQGCASNQAEPDSASSVKTEYEAHHKSDSRISENNYEGVEDNSFKIPDRYTSISTGETGCPPEEVKNVYIYSNYSNMGNRRITWSFTCFSNKYYCTNFSNGHVNESSCAREIKSDSPIDNLYDNRTKSSETKNKKADN